MQTPSPSMPVFLRERQVKAITGLSRTTRYLGVKSGTFPAPISIGARAVAWLSSDIEKWIDDRLAKSRKASPEAPAKAGKVGA